MVFKCTFGACLFLSLLLLTVPLPWVGAAVSAAAFHEGCHLLALHLLGVRVWQLKAGGHGASILMEPLCPWKELLAAAAGPGGSLLLSLLSRQFPRLAVCGLIQGLFNLLPVYPMDGGRILRVVLGAFFSQSRTDILSRWTERMTLVFLLMICLRLPWQLGIPAAGFLIFRIFYTKFPCQNGG